jgi:hypothetical protein
MQERFDIELFCEPHSLKGGLGEVRHYLTAQQRHKEAPFDLFFYQLEDHRRARFVRSQLGLMPGILWAHDLYLSDLGAEALHTSPWENTIRRYYDRDVPFADRVHPPHQLAPLAFREVSLSPVVLCSSQRGLDAVARITGPRLTVDKGGDFGLGYLPVPVPSDALLVQPRRLREQCEELHLVTAASAGLEGRPHKFLEALAGYNAAWRLTWVVDGSESARAYSLLNEFGVTDRVAVLEGRNPEQWLQVLQKADVALHLHNGFFGHVGPYLQMSLAAGVPCIGVRAIGGADFPEGVVWTVVPGQLEAVQIREAVAAIVQVGVDAAGAQGRLIMQRENEAALVAEALGSTFVRYAETLKGITAQWDQLYSDAREALFQEVQHLMDGGDSTTLSPFGEVFLPAARELGRLEK